MGGMEGVQAGGLGRALTDWTGLARLRLRLGLKLSCRVQQARRGQNCAKAALLRESLA